MAVGLQRLLSNVTRTLAATDVSQAFPAFGEGGLLTIYNRGDKVAYLRWDAAATTNDTPCIPGGPPLQMRRSDGTTLHAVCAGGETTTLLAYTSEVVILK